MSTKSKKQDCLSVEGRPPANNTRRHDFLLTWPWPWPNDLDIRTWPSMTEKTQFPGFMFMFPKAVTLVRRGGITNHHLIAYFLSQQHLCQKLPKSVDVRWGYSVFGFYNYQGSVRFGSKMSVFLHCKIAYTTEENVGFA